MRITLAILLSVVSFTFARAEPVEPTPADRAAIHEVITRQIQAFQHDDATTAFSFASPSIQQQMGTAERFLDLVRGHYQPVYHPRSVAFGRLDAEDGQIVQQVDVIGPDGQGARALYSMEHEPDGAWRISGCVLTAPDGVAT